LFARPKPAKPVHLKGRWEFTRTEEDNLNGKGVSLANGGGLKEAIGRPMDVGAKANL